MKIPIKIRYQVLFEKHNELISLTPMIIKSSLVERFRTIIT
ncbi:hypothetical protein LSO9J_100035 [Candidatus Liberibacter solanacearum]